MNDVKQGGWALTIKGKPICRLDAGMPNEADDICLTGTATVHTVPLKKA